MKKTSKVRKSLSAVSAGVFAFAMSASAAVWTIKPSPSDFIDTEASTNLVFAPLQVDTRQYVVKFSGGFSPSNDLEFAIGGDANGDGDLSPEEVETQFGIDCGERKSKSGVEGSGKSKSGVEVEQWNLSTCASGLEQEGDILCSTSTSRFDLRLTRDQQARWNLIKVTRRGFFSSEPSVTLKPRKPGMMIFVR